MFESTIARSAPDQEVWLGVSMMLDQYLQIGMDDHVLILYARAARQPAAWIATELGDRGIATTFADLDGLTEQTVTAFSAQLQSKLVGIGLTVDRLTVLCVEYDIVKPSAWIREALTPLAQASVEIYRTIMTDDEFFRQGVRVGPDRLNSINAGLLETLRSTDRFTVKTSSGSEFDVVLDPSRYRWVSNRGMPREGAFVLLPAGEVATFPSHISGILVADGAFNSTAHTKLDARLAQHPATFEIENGRVVNYRCDSPSVRKLIDRCMQLPNADQVGELGFGTNVGIERFIALNTHLNERFPGVHIGFGQSNQARGLVPRCEVHVDYIASDCVIEIAGDPPLHSADFKHLTGQHPAIEAGVFDEDLDGDCCGLFSAYDTNQCR